METRYGRITITGPDGTEWSSFLLHDELELLYRLAKKWSSESSPTHEPNYALISPADCAAVTLRHALRTLLPGISATRTERGRLYPSGSVVILPERTVSE